MRKTTSLTAWIVDLGIRVTLGTDGVFRTLRGYEPPIADPFMLRFATDRTVGNLAAHHGIRISGDTISVARLEKALASTDKATLDKVYSLDEILGHKYLGVTADAAVIREAYGLDAEELAA